MYRRSVVRRKFFFDIDGLLDKRGRADCDRLKNKQQNEYCYTCVHNIYIYICILIGEHTRSSIYRVHARERERVGRINNFNR